MARPFLAGLASVLALAACQPATPTLPPDDACGASGLQDFVGQPESVLAATTFPAPVRIIHPDTPVTEDYSPSRLNIDIGRDGRIARVWCG